MRSNIVIGLSGLSIVAASACATAQEAAPAAKGIEEVIVSARRQSEV